MTQELSSNRKSVQAASGVKAYGCVKLQLAEEYDYAELCEEVTLFLPQKLSASAHNVSRKLLTSSTETFVRLRQEKSR